MSLIVDAYNVLIERSEWFVQLALKHLNIAATAIVIVTVIGIPIGIFIAGRRVLSAIVLSIVNVVYTIPSIALFGFLVAITGVGDKSAIAAIVVYGFLPIIRNTLAGIQNVDKDVLKTAAAMGSTKWQLLYKIELPLALPIIFSGFRSMVVMVIAMTGIASFIGAGGLGVAIWRGITTYKAELTLAGSFLVAILAILVDLILGFVEKLIKKNR
jgi:osmoprotectant transport system permease protein